MPGIAARPHERYEPFPVTELQQAYLRGRSDSFPLGGVATHEYLELEGDLDLDRYIGAWRTLLERHDALRIVFDPAAGTQRVLPDPDPVPLEVLDLRGRPAEQVTAGLAAVRERLSHEVRDPERWPLFGVVAARLDDRLVRVHLSYDALIMDAASFDLLLRELSALYADPGTPLPALALTYRDYLLAEAAADQAPQGRRRHQAARDHWTRRLAELPPTPPLPLRAEPRDVRGHRFVRREHLLSESGWTAFTTRASARRLTPSAVLLAAFAEVLDRWSGASRFTVSVPSLNRRPLDPRVNEVVGEFASFTLLEVDHREPATFTERARAVTRRLFTDLEHASLGGPALLRELARRHGAERALMPVVLTSGLAWRGTETELDRVLRPVYRLTQTPQVYLDVQLAQRRGGLSFSWDVVDEIFPEGVPDAMFTAFTTLLGALASADTAWDAPDGALPAGALPGGPGQAEGLSGPDREVPPVLVHTAFAEQVAARPDHPAVIAPGRVLSYARLWEETGRIGTWLRERGARPNSLVGVLVSRGLYQVLAAHGVLRSGAAFLPIDPASPPARVARLLERAGARLVLTESALADTIDWPPGTELLALDRALPASEPDAPSESTAPDGPEAGPDDLAYVLFTSGSTGEPKGVMVEHRGLVNCLAETVREFAVGPGDRALGLTALHHDMSGFDLFGVLGAGGTLVVPDADGGRDAAHWAELIATHEVTVWNSVPAMMEMLLAHVAGQAASALGTLRLVFLGGDWIPLRLPGELAALAGDARLVSVGGPTETTLWNIWYPVDRVDPAWRSVPYGRPLANTTYYVLDRWLRECPPGVTGELCCSGVGVARGYLDDPERTDAAFVVHPRTGRRLYRTGDLGRYRADGTIEFVGRADHRVKINGQRVEPGEVEAALRGHPGVREVVVTATAGPDGRGHRGLHAHVLPADPPPTPAELRVHLGRLLPAHMVPSAVSVLDVFPLTGNGKVDRLALAAAGAGGADGGTDGGVRDEPGTALERLVAQVWAEELQLPRVGPREDFFVLGGDSLLATRVTTVLRDLLEEEAVSVRQLLRTCTVAGLADELTRLDEVPGRLERLAEISLEVARLSDEEVEQALGAGRG
jgi:amino acid adenylation domain-containing protein